jgi:predicted component of type VI protein secretion system
MVSPAQRAAQRAQNAYRRIQDKPTTIVFRKPNPPGRPTSLAAQTLRVEVDNRASVTTGATGSAPRLGVLVYGWRDHPSLPNSDIAEGYTFTVGGDLYRIEDVILTLGEIQGTGVRTG